MKIVIASDSYKGSASSLEIAGAIEKSVLEILPEAKIIKISMADGGEGTLEALSSLPNAKRITVDTVDALSRPIQADMLKLDEEVFFIEMAQANGLTLVSDQKYTIEQASSYGTGVLIKAALDLGAKTIYFGIGGSATNDLGMGMLQALGVRFYDNHQKETNSILEVYDIGIESLDPRWSEVELFVLSDVKNPLLGSNGASFVFGPQKGMDTKDLFTYDLAFRRITHLVRRKFGKSMENVEGAGAAGGVGYACLAFLNGTLQSGVHTVLDLIDFLSILHETDLIITGEGRVDQQSLSGKVILGILERSHSIPVMVIAGQVDSNFVNPGFISVHSCYDDRLSLEENMKQVLTNVGNTTHQAFQEYKKKPKVSHP